MNTRLSRFLAGLRGGVSVEDAARQAGVAVSTVYKAEGGGYVKWETIQRIYGRWLADQRKLVECLSLWAAAQNGTDTNAAEVAEVIGSLMEEEPGYPEASSGLTERSRTILDRFSAAYGKCGWVREIAERVVDLHDRISHPTGTGFSK